MTNTGKQIIDLITDHNKSASDMTHALKKLGNGNMQKGFTYIGKYFTEEINLANKKGLVKGRIQGGIVGILGALTLCNAVRLFIDNQHESLAHEKEGQKILKELELNPSSIDTTNTNNINNMKDQPK